MYKLLKQEGHARRGQFETPHGVVQTPVFMNVGTQGAIKGALSARDLKEINCQVELSNTYHLHVRPGDLIEPRNSGTSADKKTSVVTLFHGHYRPIARLIVSSDDPLPGALSKGAFFGRVKSVPDGNTGEFRIEIQAKSPKDDRLI